MQTGQVEAKHAAAADAASRAAAAVRDAQKTVHGATAEASRAKRTAQASHTAHEHCFAGLQKAKAAVKVHKQQLGAREKQAKADKAKLEVLQKEHDMALAKVGSSAAALKAAQQGRRGTCWLFSGL